MPEDRCLTELREIRRYLSILALVVLRPAVARFEHDVLRTDNRVRIFRAFDGERTPKEVGDAADVTDQAVRDLIKDLRGKGYVTLPASGAQVASVSYEAILDWYHAQPTEG